MTNSTDAEIHDPMPAASAGHESGIMRVAGHDDDDRPRRDSAVVPAGSGDSSVWQQCGNATRVYLVDSRLVAAAGVVSAIESDAGRNAPVGAEIRDESGRVVAVRRSDGWELTP